MKKKKEEMLLQQTTMFPAPPLPLPVSPFFVKRKA